MRRRRRGGRACLGTPTLDITAKNTTGVLGLVYILTDAIQSIGGAADGVVKGVGIACRAGRLPGQGWGRRRGRRETSAIIRALGNTKRAASTTGVATIAVMRAVGVALAIIRAGTVAVLETCLSAAIVLRPCIK